MKTLMCLFWILTPFTFQSDAATIVALIQPGGDDTNAGDTLIYNTVTGASLMVDTTVTLSATNYATHPWLGNLLTAGRFPFARPNDPTTNIQVAVLPDHNSLADTSPIVIPTFNFVPLWYVGITCVCRSNAQGRAVVTVLTDLRTLRAVTAVAIENGAGPSSSVYETNEGLALPLVIPSGATETLSLIATPDLNRDGKVTAPDLLMFQSAWHMNNAPAVKAK